MPLRDHFSEESPQRFNWEGFHSQWAGTIVRHLNRNVLPEDYHAEPRVRLGTLAAIDVGTREVPDAGRREQAAELGGPVALYSPPTPALTFEADLSQEDLFEVQVLRGGAGELVAAIELISPGNKDRPESRHDFVVKCASLLKAHVAVTLIDIVTNRQASLFKELMEYLEKRDQSTPYLGQLYCCSLLPRGTNGHGKVDAWPEVLEVGKPLPQLPLWLRDDLPVPLDLETTYEEACLDLRA